MLLDLKTQKSLCVLADTGNYQQAAKKLFTSQPNLSIQIKKLEDNLGVQLFYRSDKHVLPTYCGQLVIAKCREMLKLDATLEQELNQYQRGITGMLRVGCYLRISPAILPRTLGLFLKKYPQIDVRINENHLQELKQDLKSGRLDLIICNQKFLEPQFDYVQLKKDHLLLCLSPGDPAIGKAAHLPEYDFPYLSLKELQDYRFIVQLPDQIIRTYTDDAFNFEKLHPRNMFTTSNIETAVQMAGEGIGAAFCMESYVRNIHTDKPVNYFLVGDVNNYAYFCICYLKNREHPPYFFDFINMVQSVV
jgi:DNA-binding transcriptional LysR family regulator